MGSYDCDLVTTATELLVEEARLEDGSVGVGDPREIAEDCNPEWASLASGQGSKRGESSGVLSSDRRVGRGVQAS